MRSLVTLLSLGSVGLLYAEDIRTLVTANVAMFEFKDEETKLNKDQREIIEGFYNEQFEKSKIKKISIFTWGNEDNDEGKKKEVSQTRADKINYFVQSITNNEDVDEIKIFNMEEDSSLLQKLIDNEKDQIKSAYHEKSSEKPYANIGWYLKEVAKPNKAVLLIEGVKTES